MVVKCHPLTIIIIIIIVKVTLLISTPVILQTTSGDDSKDELCTVDLSIDASQCSLYAVFFFKPYSPCTGFIITQKEFGNNMIVHDISMSVKGSITHLQYKVGVLKINKVLIVT